MIQSVNHPKTVVVKSSEHDGQEVRINEADFNPDIHEKIGVAKPKIIAPEGDEAAE